MNNQNNKEKLINYIGEKRYKHSIRVCETALKLNKKLNLDIQEEKIILASVYHDCAKYNEELFYQKYKDKYKDLDNYRNHKAVFHAFLGEVVAKEEYDIRDIEVLSAIKYHTTGNVFMTDFEKLIFLSDAIEPKRNYEKVDEIRKIADENLDLAVLETIDNTIKYIIKQKKEIYLLTVEARNSIVKGI